jgi:hypothetical protein
MDASCITRHSQVSHDTRSMLQLCHFCVVESGLRCQTGDMAVNRPFGQIYLCIRKAKGDHQPVEPGKPVLSIPIGANSRLADLLEW